MAQQIACIQMTSGQNVTENLQIATQFIEEAVDKGAGLIVLPEMFALMGMDERDKLTHQEAINRGPIQDFLREQSARHGIWLVGGTIPISHQEHKNKVSATCLVFNEKGVCVGRYDKIHLFDVKVRQEQKSYSESNTIVPGNKVVVIPTPFGRLGLAVCYDLRFPELFRQMVAEGMELLALPSAFTYATGESHWEILVRARAIENLIFVAAACQTGTHPGGRKTFGHSMIINPWGNIEAILPLQNGVIVSALDFNYQKTLRAEFPVLSHRRF